VGESIVGSANTPDSIRAFHLQLYATGNRSVLARTTFWRGTGRDAYCQLESFGRALSLLAFACLRSLAPFLYRRYGVNHDSVSIDASGDSGTSSGKFVEVSSVAIQDVDGIAHHKDVVSTLFMNASPRA